MTIQQYVTQVLDQFNHDYEGEPTTREVRVVSFDIPVAPVGDHVEVVPEGATTSRIQFEIEVSRKGVQV